MVLSLPHQDHIKCVAWACCHAHWISWPKSSLQVKMLRKEHFEPIWHEQEGKITVKDIPYLTDVLKYKGHITMSKPFREFETYLSQHCGVDDFVLDYYVWPKLVAASWIKTMDSCSIFKLKTVFQTSLTLMRWTLSAAGLLRLYLGGMLSTLSSD